MCRRRPAAAGDPTELSTAPTASAHTTATNARGRREGRLHQEDALLSPGCIPNRCIGRGGDGGERGGGKNNKKNCHHQNHQWNTITADENTHLVYREGPPPFPCYVLVRYLHFSQVLMWDAPKGKKKRSHGKKRSPLGCHQSADGENWETKKKKKTKKMGKKKKPTAPNPKTKPRIRSGLRRVCVCHVCRPPGTSVWVPGGHGGAAPARDPSPVLPRAPLQRRACGTATASPQ